MRVSVESFFFQKTSIKTTVIFRADLSQIGPLMRVTARYHIGPEIISDFGPFIPPSGPNSRPYSHSVHLFSQNFFLHCFKKRRYQIIPMSTSSTIEATTTTNERTCGWCAEPGASERCQCKNVYYCNKECHRSSWDIGGHRLRCSGVCDKVSDEVDKKFKNGDVVRITGLTRAAHLNGLLAEVQHYNYDEKKGEPRYVIMYTIKESCQIKQSSIKPENIEAYLRVHEAAARSTKLRKGDCSTQAQMNEATDSYVELQNTVLPTLSGGQIVERLKRGDNDLIATLLLPPSKGRKTESLTFNQVKETLQSGIIDCCLQRYEYPRCLDDSLEEDIANDDPLSEQRQATRNAQYVYFLANLLNKNQGPSPSFEDTMNQYRIEAAKKMAPLIMLCASKKRRFFGKAELWWGFNMALSSLLQNCLLADAAASRILLHKFEPKVTEALLEQVIFSFTVDPKQYLHKKIGNEKGTKWSRPPKATQNGHHSITNGIGGYKQCGTGRSC